MEAVGTNTLTPSYAMNGGDGAHSYVRNSSSQREFIDVTKETIKEEIVKKLDINQLLLSHSPNLFRIADFGCSTGPNTFEAVQIILETIELKFKSRGLNSQVPGFQVFFNDVVSNDFNTLFASLPPERQYYAAGVPGSFHKMLFPKGFLHFAYSSSALNWLSEVPKEVLDKNSLAWNKGRIYYNSTQKEVLEAYSAQFAKDFMSFLNARAHELVDGGLMSLVIPGMLNMATFSQITMGFHLEVLGSCLLDMAAMCLVSEEMVDSFNLPVYFPTTKELEVVIKSNGCFIIERMETFGDPQKNVTIAGLQESAISLRAALEGVIEKHFGSKLANCLFELHSKKVAEVASSVSPGIQTLSVVFVFLKRVQS